MLTWWAIIPACVCLAVSTESRHVQGVGAEVGLSHLSHLRSLVSGDPGDELGQGAVYGRDVGIYWRACRVS